MKALNASVPTVNGILAALGPDLGTVHSTLLYTHPVDIGRVDRALGVIGASKRMEALADLDDLDNDPAVTGFESKLWPVLPMDMLDPVVHQAAIGHWNGGMYRSAVGDAATALSKYTQQRVGRDDIEEFNLMEAAFSLSPPEPGKPRLRCPGDHRLKTIKNLQKGALGIASNCFTAFRNPAQHSTDEWNPLMAFERLATISMVARWVRYWDVVRVPITAPPVPVIVPKQATTSTTANAKTSST